MCSLSRWLARPLWRSAVWLASTECELYVVTDSRVKHFIKLETDGQSSHCSWRS